MVQPRKEQVKNLKTKYTKFVSVGTLSLGGGPTQTIVNTGLESFYDNLLNSTITKVVGGADTSAPAILYGGLGPWALVAGNQFSITLPGVNGGLPVTITIVAGDIVTIAGPVVTTSRLVNRINTTLAGFGVATAVASNDEGRIILTSADTTGVTYGDSASIIIQEITAGIVNTLGFSTSTSSSALGTTAPRRGVVTVSDDGLGGYVQLKDLRNAVARQINIETYTFRDGTYDPVIHTKDAIYARLKAFPGPVINGRKFEFTYYRNGYVSPRFITSQSNFLTLGVPGDTITINLDYGNDVTLSVPIDYNGATITSVQDVVDYTNATYQVFEYNLFFLGTIIVLKRDPYTFIDPATRDSFFINRQSGPDIHINPDFTVRTNGDFETYIDTQIGLAGDSGFLDSTSFGGDNTSIVSSELPSVSLFNSVNTTLTVSPGNPGGVTPGDFMDTIDMLGVAPGTYTSPKCCRLYGNDEIMFFCPSNRPGATMQITVVPAMVPKLGLPALVNVSTTEGFEKVESPTVQSLIPEMMEFSEEVDDYDPKLLNFKAEVDSNPVDLINGLDNISLPAILGKDGKLDANAIPKLLSFLGVKNIRLGQETADDSNGFLSPRIDLPADSNNSGPVLIWESKDANFNSHAPTRIYTSGSSIYLTVNARITSLALAWARDISGFTSTIWIIGSSGITAIGKQSSATWAHTAWEFSFKTNFHGSATSLNGISFPNAALTLGEGLLSTAAQYDIARTSTPIVDFQRILIHEIKGSSIPAANCRIYFTVGFSNVILETVYNAVWNSTTLLWTKDDTSFISSYTAFGLLGHTGYVRDAIVGTWNDSGWSRTYMDMNLNATIPVFDWNGRLDVGDTIADSTTARIRVQRYSPSANKRTLVFESPTNGVFAPFELRIYADTGSSAGTSSGYSITLNAVWNFNTDRWNQGAGAYDSYIFNISYNGKTFFGGKAAAASPWTDAITSWDKDLDAVSGGYVTQGEYSYHTPKSITKALCLANGVYQLNTADTNFHPWMFNSASYGWISEITSGNRRELHIPIPYLPKGSVITNINVRVNMDTVNVASFDRTGVKVLTQVNTLVSSSTSSSVVGRPSGSAAGLYVINLNTVLGWIDINVDTDEAYSVVIIPATASATSGNDELHWINVEYTSPGPRGA